MLIRMLRLDAVGLVRLQQVGENVSLWAQPLGVVVRREIRARMTVGDRTVSAAELLTAVTADTAGAVALPAPRDEAWRVTLPPRSGWSVLDSVPVQVIRDLADSAGRVVRAAADPVGAGESLLDQETLRVSQGADVVVVPFASSPCSIGWASSVRRDTLPMWSGWPARRPGRGWRPGTERSISDEAGCGSALPDSPTGTQSGALTRLCAAVVR
ncbi:MAG: hypothetical protein WKG07_40230 [Hymenobacter sp.]